MTVGDILEANIELARHKDVVAIHSLAQQRSLSNRSTTEDHQGGFLVSNFTPDDYHRYVDLAEHFFVARDAEKIIGFVLSFLCDQNSSLEWLESSSADVLGDMALIKQICVSKDHAGSGIGTDLYSYLFQQMPHKTIVASVVDEPPNVASARFHSKLGFHPYFTYTPSDEFERTVWRRLPGGMDRRLPRMARYGLPS